MPDHSQPLRETDVSADPYVQFARWYDEVAPLVPMPEAVALATVDAEGRPSARMVLMKGWSDGGFVFYTNYESRKGAELAANAHAALLFYWEVLGRQVRVEGTAATVSGAESDEYFASRPYGARVGAHASAQSRTVESRDDLDLRVRQLSERFDGAPVPRPAWWGGYRLRPAVFEFWQNRDDRLHDRLRYRRDGDRWVVDRLQP